jgi:hypothetical protein
VRVLVPQRRDKDGRQGSEEVALKQFNGSRR